MKICYWRFLLLCAVCVVMFFAFGSDEVSIPKEFPQQDKIEHIVSFFTLATFSILAFPRAGFIDKILPSLICFGVAIELLQNFTPNHACDIRDVLADTMGILLIYPGYQLLRRISIAYIPRAIK